MRGNRGNFSRPKCARARRSRGKLERNASGVSHENASVLRDKKSRAEEKSKPDKTDQAFPWSGRKRHSKAKTRRTKDVDAGDVGNRARRNRLRQPSWP